jgi:hypothetical protein
MIAPETGLPPGSTTRPWSAMASPRVTLGDATFASAVWAFVKPGVVTGWRSANLPAPTAVTPADTKMTAASVAVAAICSFGDEHSSDDGLGQRDYHR